MADRSLIEWTDATWTPVRARHRATGKVGWHCEPASPGCANCYSEAFNERRLGTGLPFKPGHRGDVEHFLDETMLLVPLRWRGPRRIFVFSMTDLFGDWVPDAWIDRVFAVMALCPQHTFQVLTKRAARMRAYMGARSVDYSTALASAWADVRMHVSAALEKRALLSVWPQGGACLGRDLPWPLSNIWLGVSVEDQRRADERRDDLAALAAAGWTTFVSYEPALGPVDWTGWGFLSWLISGGENGPRPSHPDWHRAARDFGAAHAIPYLFKQWGSWAPAEEPASETQKDEELRGVGAMLSGQYMRRIGKKTAGRLLDGRTHDAFPVAATAPRRSPTDERIER